MRCPPYKVPGTPRGFASRRARRCNPGTASGPRRMCAWHREQGDPATIDQGRSRDLPVPAQNACVRAKVLRPRRTQLTLAITRQSVQSPPLATTWTSETYVFSRLNSPARTPPVNASSGTLRYRPHDSGLTWIATPFVIEDFHLLHSAGFNRRYLPGTGAGDQGLPTRRDLGHIAR